MPTESVVVIEGAPIRVPSGASVVAALAIAGIDMTKRSLTGERRGPLCGMGVCFECRVTIDGIPQQLACRTFCRDGMEVTLDAD